MQTGCVRHDCFPSRSCSHPKPIPAQFVGGDDAIRLEQGVRRRGLWPLSDADLANLRQAEMCATVGVLADTVPQNVRSSRIAERPTFIENLKRYAVGASCGGAIFSIAPTPSVLSAPDAGTVHLWENGDSDNVSRLLRKAPADRLAPVWAFDRVPGVRWAAENAFQARDEIGGAERPAGLLGRSQRGKSGIVGPFGD